MTLTLIIHGASSETPPSNKQFALRGVLVILTLILGPSSETPPSILRTKVALLWLKVTSVV